MMEGNIGQSLVRREDRRFLPGQGRYVDDFNWPGQPGLSAEMAWGGFWGLLTSTRYDLG